mmetsp:Transcript_70356/g.141711  ORF Transcript_70356/g.141711 Transcript_70356/m.141711 type:complete len:145 (+) Transcript_70356:166-600(+)
MDRNESSPRVDISRQRYPYSIVWGPLGPLTCCCPCVGHMGIGDSQGKIHDFAGPYCINVDSFMVGTVWRYAIIRGADKNPDWDAAISQADEKYKETMHNICCSNCHHHTADAITYSGRDMGRGHSGLFSTWLYCCANGNCTWCG